MQISRAAIDGVISTVEATAADYATAAAYPDPPVADAPEVLVALGQLTAAWTDRLRADDLLFASIATALDTAWSVMESADSELAGFLDQTRVMD